MILKTTKDKAEYKAKHCSDNCPICGREMSAIAASNRVVDHDHTTGYVREVLCRNCNGIEGKINKLCQRASRYLDKYAFLKSLMRYWSKHEQYPNKNVTFIAPKVKRKRKGHK